MRGGKREGAGRPPAPDHLKRQPVTVRLPQWLIDEVDLSAPGDRGGTIEKALMKYMQLKKPS